MTDLIMILVLAVLGLITYLKVMGLEEEVTQLRNELRGEGEDQHVCN